MSQQLLLVTTFYITKSPKFEIHCVFFAIFRFLFQAKMLAKFITFRWMYVVASSSILIKFYYMRAGYIARKKWSLQGFSHYNNRWNLQFLVFLLNYVGNQIFERTKINAFMFQVPRLCIHFANANNSEIMTGLYNWL